MKNLIRKVLREYTEPKVTIYQISEDSPILKNILNEQGSSKNGFYDDEGNKININSVKRELAQYFKLHYNLPSNNPSYFCGKFNIKSDKCLIKFRLENEHSIRDHFVERIYRLSQPDYQIDGKMYNKSLVDPSKFEGINLFFDNIDNIISKIEEANTPIKGRAPWEKTRNKSFYMIKLDNLFSIIFELNKDSRENNMYNVIFVTQLKGDEMFNTPELRKSIKIIV
jgi:hypothetical protein